MNEKLTTCGHNKCEEDAKKVLNRAEELMKPPELMTATKVAQRNEWFWNNYNWAFESNRGWIDRHELIKRAKQSVIDTESH